VAGAVGYLVCLRGPSFRRAVGSQLPHAGVDVKGVEQALAHLFHLGHAHFAQVLRLLLRAPETAKYEKKIRYVPSYANGYIYIAALVITTNNMKNLNDLGSEFPISCVPDLGP
jgi:hypothetical protein